MSEHPIDSRELLQRIAARKANEEWTPLPPDDLTDALPPMHTDAVVTALHDRWILPNRLSPGDAGRGWKRAILTPVGRLVFRVLAPYLRAERELLGQLVRSNDALARRCDELAREIARRQALEAENQLRLAAVLHRRDPIDPAR